MLKELAASFGRPPVPMVNFQAGHNVIEDDLCCMNSRESSREGIRQRTRGVAVSKVDAIQSDRGAISCDDLLAEFPEWVMDNFFRRSMPEQSGPTVRVWMRLTWATGLIAVALCTEASADLVKLNNGGELRGKIVSSADNKERIRLETMTGAVVVVEKTQVQFVTNRSLAIEEYETQSKQIEDTVDAHWELSEWCRQKGLTKQREAQLIRVTELAPDHDKAQSILGRVWHQGAWIDRDELMKSQGYVKYKNKYITPQELEVIENTAEELDREKGWFQKVRLWHGWLDGQHENRRAQALSNLKGIDDPNAAPAVIKFLAADVRVPVRELGIAILVKISGTKAVAGLVKLALFDESTDIRSAALEGIGRPHYERAQKAFITALKNDSNLVVCRAATALGQIGDTNAVGPLIEALMTAHVYQVPVDGPGNQTYSFATDGSSISNTPVPPAVMTAVRNGQLLPPIVVQANDTPTPPKRLVNVRIEQNNAEVLAALGKLTQQNFGYDKRTWHLWWAAEKNSGAKTKGKG
jgi:hypothetical protein